MPIGETKESGITGRGELDKQNNSGSKLIGFLPRQFFIHCQWLLQ